MHLLDNWMLLCVLCEISMILVGLVARLKTRHKGTDNTTVVFIFTVIASIETIFVSMAFIKASFDQFIGFNAFFALIMTIMLTLLFWAILIVSAIIANTLHC